MRFMASPQIRPVIDREFTFDEARLAYEHLKAGRHAHLDTSIATGGA